MHKKRILKVSSIYVIGGLNDNGMGVVLKHKTISTIVGHAQHVMRSLGKGHRENVYCKALQISFGEENMTFRSEVCCPIFFKGKIIAHGRADFVISNVIIEVKANRNPIDIASDQLKKYLKSLSDLERTDYIGVILNFNQNTGKVDVLTQNPVVKHNLKTVSRFFVKKTRG